MLQDGAFVVDASQLKALFTQIDEGLTVVAALPHTEEAWLTQEIHDVKSQLEVAFDLCVVLERVSKHRGMLAPLFQGERPLPYAREAFSAWEALSQQMFARIHGHPICESLFLLEEVMALKDRADEILALISKELETQRQLFPRLRFVSNDDLLEMISCDGDLPHLEKMLSYMLISKELELSQEGHILGVRSNTEHLGLEQPLAPSDGALAEWLLELEKRLTGAVRAEKEDCLKNFLKMGLKELATEYTQQAVLLAKKAEWTSETETAIQDNTVKALRLRFQETID